MSFYDNFVCHYSFITWVAGVSSPWLLSGTLKGRMPCAGAYRDTRYLWRKAVPDAKGGRSRLMGMARFSTPTPGEAQLRGNPSRGCFPVILQM